MWDQTQQRSLELEDFGDDRYETNHIFMCYSHLTTSAQKTRKYEIGNYFEPFLGLGLKIWAWTWHFKPKKDSIKFSYVTSQWDKNRVNVLSLPGLLIQGFCFWQQPYSIYVRKVWKIGKVFVGTF